jgi:hypothetical protein
LNMVRCEDATKAAGTAECACYFMLRTESLNAPPR